MANEVTIMPTKVLGGSYFGYDNWDGYPQEREQLLTFIKNKKIEDVVFITGDIHTFITGDVKTNMGAGESDHRRYWILTKLTNFEWRFSQQRRPKPAHGKTAGTDRSR